MLKEFELTGKAAIEMGGGRGIGKGIALTLAEAGADVLAVARTESEVLQTAEEVQRLGVKGRCHQCRGSESGRRSRTIPLGSNRHSGEQRRGSAGEETLGAPTGGESTLGEGPAGLQHHHHRG